MNELIASTKYKFWEEKRLNELTEYEWEQLCDGCGLCCLNKVEDEEDNIIYYTKVGCKLLDKYSCKCNNYANRQKFVPDCISLNYDLVQQIKWLPETCSYRLLDEGKTLPKWHHLICGDKRRVHIEGISLSKQIINEEEEPNWDSIEYLAFSFEMKK